MILQLLQLTFIPRETLRKDTSQEEVQAAVSQYAAQTLYFGHTLDAFAWARHGLESNQNLQMA